MALAHKFPKMCLQCQSWIWLCRNFLQERKMFSLSLHLVQFALGWETERLRGWVNTAFPLSLSWQVAGASSDCMLYVLSSSSVNNCAWEAWHWDSPLHCCLRTDCTSQNIVLESLEGTTFLCCVDLVPMPMHYAYFITFITNIWFPSFLRKQPRQIFSI